MLWKLSWNSDEMENFMANIYYYTKILSEEAGTQKRLTAVKERARVPMSHQGLLFPREKAASQWRHTANIPILNHVQYSLNYFRAQREKNGSQIYFWSQKNIDTITGLRQQQQKNQTTPKTPNLTYEYQNRTLKYQQTLRVVGGNNSIRYIWGLLVWLCICKSTNIIYHRSRRNIMITAVNNKKDLKKITLILDSPQK